MSQLVVISAVVFTWLGWTLHKLSTVTKCTGCNKKGITQVDYIYCEDFFCTTCMVKYVGGNDDTTKD